jgi:hypothetical protein
LALVLNVVVQTFEMPRAETIACGTMPEKRADVECVHFVGPNV